MPPSHAVLVAHRFPPEGQAGVELYTLRLARALQCAGVRVTVVTARLRPGGAQYTVTREEVDGVPVRGVVQNWPYRDLPAAVDDPALDRVFGGLLDELSPDLVAFQSLQGLSWGMPEEARRRGLRVALHLHDADAVCASGGQRRHPDGSLCLPVDPRRCGACFDRFRHREGPLERAALRIAGRMPAGLPPDLLHRTFAALPSGARDTLRRVNGRLGRRRRAEAEDGVVDPRVHRRREHVERGLQAIDVAVSPSRFLAASLTGEGLSLPPLRVVPTGVPAGARAPLPPRSPLRVLLLGTWVEHKGQHVLAEAVAGLDGVEATAVGPAPFPSWRDAVVQRSGGALRARGAVPAEDVPGLIGEHHVVVVPSVWAENAPLVALEARAAGRPVVASDLGGLIELVDEGVDGLRFPAGDAAGLRGVLMRLRDEEGLLERLASSVRPPPTLDTWARSVLEAWA